MPTREYVRELITRVPLARIFRSNLSVPRKKSLSFQRYPTMLPMVLFKYFSYVRIYEYMYVGKYLLRPLTSRMHARPTYGKYVLLIVESLLRLSRLS